MAEIRPMQQSDREEVLAMMRVFYDSPAVMYQVPDEVIRRDVEDCIGTMPFVEGYILEENGNAAGYAMLAKSYSTEFGGLCIWIEDLYLKPEYRGKGIGTQFFEYVEKKYAESAVRFRLEVERENESAIHVYRKCGYHKLGYVEMTKEV